MHPRYKLDYFKHNGWQSDWIEEVQDLARSHYTSYYKPSAAEEASALAAIRIDAYTIIAHAFFTRRALVSPWDQISIKRRTRFHLEPFFHHHVIFLDIERDPYFDAMWLVEPEDVHQQRTKDLCAGEVL